MNEPTTAQSFDTLGVRVGQVEVDIREVNDRLLGLDTKIDKAVASLATEFRSALSSLTSQLSERQRTPWAVLISASGFIVAILGLFGSQALNPLQADVKSLKETVVPRAENEARYEALRSDIKTLREQIVPRDEINYRADVTSRRFTSLETLAETLGKRRYDELQEQLRDLRNENRDLKRGVSR